MFQQVCALMQIDPIDVAKVVGLSADNETIEHRGITTAEYFAAWNAMLSLSPVPDAITTLGKAFQSMGFNPACFAMQCSPDLLTGLKRLSVYKILVGPMKVTINETDQHVDVVFGSIDENHPLPHSMAAMEMVHLVYILRLQTGHDVSPMAVRIGDVPNSNSLGDFLKCDLQHVRANDPAMFRFSRTDATRPFVSADDHVWEMFEPEFQRRLTELRSSETVSERASSILVKLLPLGDVSVDAVAKQLNMSKRSLQRGLSAQGTSYQKLLDRLRHELAIQYLTNPDLSLSEISYLLGFDEPNSFFKAFQKWCGRTPKSMRQSLLVAA